MDSKITSHLGMKNLCRTDNHAHFLFAVTCLLALSLPASGLKSSCEAPDSKEGESAKVACKFEGDVSKTQQDFQVQLYKELVLNCAWFSGKVECFAKDGYRFDGNITNQLIIEIPIVKKENGGQYKCVVTPSEPEEVSPCYLNITGGEIERNDTRPNNVSEKPSKVSDRPGDVSEKPGDASEKTSKVSDRPGDVSEKPDEVRDRPGDGSEIRSHAIMKCLPFFCTLLISQFLVK